MRFRFDPTPEQRAGLRARLERLQQPAAALELLRSALPADSQPESVTCTVRKVHSDRFVLRARVRSRGGAERAYALKVYSDDLGQRVWEHAQALAAHHRPNGGRVCLPIRYLPHEHTLVFPWVDGPFLSKIVDDRKLELLRQAAGLAAELHRLPIVPEQLTTAETPVEETRLRCDRLRRRWPEMTDVVAPLLPAIEEAVTALDPAEPAPVHGDMAAGQFVWTGDSLVLLDLDMFGYTDPAYDAGHFLAQLERRCVTDPTLPPHAARWVSCFREAYLAAMPQVSPRNVSFYQGLTLVNKMYTLCRKQMPDWPRLVPRLAARARAALEAVAVSGQPR